MLASAAFILFWSIFFYGAHRLLQRVSGFLARWNVLRYFLAWTLSFCLVLTGAILVYTWW